MKIVKWISNIIIFLLLAFCIVVELYLHGAFHFVEQLDTVTSMQELTSYIEQQLQNENSEITFYAKNLTEEDIKSCNRNMDGFLGSVDTYVVEAEKKDGTMKVKMQLQYSDNGYVIKALKDSSVLENMTARSRQMYDKVCEIMESEIKPDMSDYEKEKAIHDYLALHAKYGELSGESQEQSYKAYGVLVLGQGVCNAYAEAMYLLMNACDIECRMVVGTADSGDHAWNMVCLDNEWYQVDVTWDDPTPDQEGYVQYQYFNVTDEVMAKTHTWEQSQYPECNKTQYNYYVYNNKVCKDYAAFQKKVNRQIANKKKMITLLVSDYDENTYNMSFILDEHSNVSKASYSVSESEMGTIISIQVQY